jgi:hypothetical protein
MYAQMIIRDRATVVPITEMKDVSRRRAASFFRTRSKSPTGTAEAVETTGADRKWADTAVAWILEAESMLMAFVCFIKGVLPYRYRTGNTVVIVCKEWIRLVRSYPYGAVRDSPMNRFANQISALRNQPRRWGLLENSCLPLAYIVVHLLYRISKDCHCCN